MITNDASKATMLILPTRDAIREFRIMVGDAIEPRDLLEIVTQIFMVFLNFGCGADAEIPLQQLPNIDRIGVDFAIFDPDPDAGLAKVMDYVYRLAQQIKMIIIMSNVLTPDGDFHFALDSLLDDDSVLTNLPY